MSYFLPARAKLFADGADDGRLSGRFRALNRRFSDHFEANCGSSSNSMRSSWHCSNARNPAACSPAYQISEATLYRWRDDVLAGGKAQLASSQAAKKQQADQVKQLEAERAERDMVIGELTIAGAIFLTKRAASTHRRTSRNHPNDGQRKPFIGSHRSGD